jgi:PDZ domain-containing protein/aspartyl protease
MIDRRSAVSLMSILPLAFTRAFAEPLRSTPVPLVQFPFELLANGIYFAAKLNGKGPYLFSLDTGSSNSVIASELVRELGIATGAAFKSTGAGSDSDEAAAIHVLDFELPGGIKRQVSDGAAISLSGLWPLLGKRFYGIIGYDVLRPFAVEIDYARRTVSLFAPPLYTLPRHTFAAHMYGRYDPQIDGSIEVVGRPPVPVRFTLDTGAGGTIVSSPLVDKYDLTSAVGHLTDTQDKGVGGAVPTEVMGRLAAISIGSFVLEKPLVALSLDKMGSLANEAISVNMGGNILRRFTVVIDYVQKTVALTPNEHFGEPFRSDASGLMLSADSKDFHKFTVDRMIRHSPAADAAIKAGDVVLAVNGRLAEKFALWELEEELKMSGAEVRLSLRRGARKIDRVLRLRSLL